MSQPAPKAPKVRDPRNGLRTSATLATVFTFLGHRYFGFEQSTVAVAVCLITGYACAILFETIDAAANDRVPGYRGGGPKKVVDFLLSAHMTSITMSFLLYANDRLAVLALAVALALGSKYFFRVQVGGRTRHFMNPSNFGLVIVLLCYQWTSSIPWGMTTDLHGWQDWALPIIVTMLGFRLNLLFTKRLPLIAAWLIGFLVQAYVRHLGFGSPLDAEIAPLTNVAMVLFTFYMITDPQTSPAEPRRQVAFGLGIAATYGVLMCLHITYTIFYAVVIVCSIRGVWLAAESVLEARAKAPARVPTQTASPVPALGTIVGPGL